MKTVAQIRYQQQYAQANSVSQALERTSSVAIYQGRDPQTGDRLLLAGDGSIVRAKYTDTKQPPSVARRFDRSRVIGSAGVFDA